MMRWTPSGCMRSVAPWVHLQHIKLAYNLKQVINAWIGMGEVDPQFQPALLMKKDVLWLIGASAGGISEASMQFLLDTMRIGMAEVYGCPFACQPYDMLHAYRRMCGKPTLLSVEAVDRGMMGPVLCFFCETMLHLRGRIRFSRGLATYFCKAALESRTVLAGLNKDGLQSLKSILHFSGISLYELMLVSNANVLFSQSGPRKAVQELQFHKSAMAAMRPLVHSNDGERTCIA